MQSEPVTLTPMSKQSRDLGDAVRARRGELGLSQRDLAKKASLDFTSIQRIESGAREKLWQRTKTKLEGALEWVPGSIDHALSGGEPTPLAHLREPSALPLSPLLLELLTASHAQLAKIAELISTTAGSSAEGDRWLQSVLQLRRPRDEIEIKMLAVDDDLRVIWSLIYARRERLRDEASDEDPRMGQSG